MEATRRDPACEMRFQTLLQWTASISGSLSLLGSGYVLHDLRAKRRANDGVHAEPSDEPRPSSNIIRTTLDYV